jgi:hypothetical protein
VVRLRINQLHNGKDAHRKKADHDGKRTERRAGGREADADAEFAIEYAGAAIDEAKYAVLEAILARKSADDAGSTCSRRG